jgi:VanZ family protein
VAAPKNHLVYRWIPSLVWMTVIFYFSSQSTSGVISNDPTVRFYVFKSFHLIEYAVLGFLLMYASKKIKIALPLAYLFACTDEVHQYFTYIRTSKFSDTLIDLMGIVVGLLCYKIVKKIFPDSFKWL